MADISLTRRGLIASSLVVAGTLAAMTVAPAGGFDAALAQFDASLAALNAAPDDDEELWNRLGDAHADAAAALAEMPAPDLRRFRAKMERVVGYYSPPRHLHDHGRPRRPAAARSGRLVPA